jgi:RNA polymerase sigma factor (sigma-70 family)
MPSQPSTQLPGPDPLRDEFEALCREHAVAARKLARSRLGKVLRRRLDSNDVVQEAFLEAARLYLGSGANRPDPREFRRWLAAVIENRIRSLSRFHVGARKRSILREVPFEQAGDPGTAVHENPVSNATGAECRERVQRALARLSPRQREVIDLVKFQGLVVREAARRMKKTPGSTSVLLYNALRRLADILEEGRG